MDGRVMYCALQCLVLLIYCQLSTPYTVDPTTGKHVQSYPDYGSAVDPSAAQIRRRPILSSEIPAPHIELAVVPNWPDPKKKLGQVSAVTVDQHGSVVAFHRGPHVWNGLTFNLRREYMKKEDGPIMEPTITVFHPDTGAVLREWGSGMFYMPHGLFIDHEDNVWLTDVALHQVFKFPPLSTLGNNRSSPLISLGERFIPGRDMTHFCQPSDVAVLRTGEFFVSDGYCNSRIIKFNRDGHHLLTWGRNPFEGPSTGRPPPPYQLFVPHALTIAEDRGLVCVADRENGRVSCFHSGNGTFAYQILSEQFGTRVFSVAYSPVTGGEFYLVNGPDPTSAPVRGFVVDANSLRVVSDFRNGSSDLSNPHDIAVSPDGGSIYVAEIGPNRVWKFVRAGGWNVTSPAGAVVSQTIYTSTKAPSVTEKSESTGHGTITTSPRLNVSSIFPTGLNLMASSPLGSVSPSSVAAVVGLVVILVCILAAGIALCARVRRRGRPPVLEFDGSDTVLEYSSLMHDSET